MSEKIKALRAKLPKVVKKLETTYRGLVGEVAIPDVGKLKWAFDALLCSCNAGELRLEQLNDDSLLLVVPHLKALDRQLNQAKTEHERELNAAADLALGVVEDLLRS